MKTPSVGMAIVLVSLCLSTSLVWAHEGSDDGIGLFTAVQGAVTVTHPGAPNILPVNVHDEVLFKDLIQTRTESRTKAFFEDDSILTVGENSRVEIAEHIYNPDRNMRRMIVNLAQGRLRALVAKVFKGPGSAFEVHTPTAVVAARGTYFVVWVENGVTGIVNIGNSGRVDFTSEGNTVTVAPGEYSIAPGGSPPAQPLVYDAGPGNGGVARAEKVMTLKNGVRDTVAGTVNQTTGAVGTVLNSGVAQTVETVGKILGRAGETIENTLGKTTETAGKTLAKVDNALGQQIAILASARNAIEGTIIKDTPRPEMAKDTVRVSHIPVFATPVLPATPAVTANKTTSSPNGTTVPLVTSSPQGTPLAPATLVGATTPLAPTTVAPVAAVLAPVAPVLAPVTPMLAPVAPVLAPVTPIVPVTPPAVISGVVGKLGVK
ncbi:MAG: FecR domain-containing protein [Nitrospiraceae bacterium]